MRYAGGKSKIAKELAKEISRHVGEDCPLYVEPFMGSLAVASEVRKILPQIPMDLSDAFVGLNRLYRYVRAGGQLPDDITKEAYTELKGSGRRDPLTVFVGFGSSFGGKWFGGYVRDDRWESSLLTNSKRSLKRKVAALTDDVALLQSDYKYLDIPDRATVYCDPPYRNTQGYHGTQFDSDEFWAWATALSERCVVLVSEYQAPEGWEAVWETERRSTLSSKDNKEIRTEKLWRHVE